ncbi:MAG: hypothetical protein AMXMBFR64_33980 [Myxococcales bacterium]
MSRIDDEALQVLTLLNEATYRKRKAETLREANHALNRIRVLLEVAVRIAVLPRNAHAHALVALDEVGRMLGGWIAHAAAREGPRGPARPPGAMEPPDAPTPTRRP